MYADGPWSNPPPPNSPSKPQNGAFFLRQRASSTLRDLSVRRGRPVRPKSTFDQNARLAAKVSGGDRWPPFLFVWSLTLRFASRMTF
jgi:hypothetical protein